MKRRGTKDNNRRKQKAVTKPERRKKKSRDQTRETQECVHGHGVSALSPKANTHLHLQSFTKGAHA